MNIPDDGSTHTRLECPMTMKELCDVAVSEHRSGDFGDSGCGEPLSPHRVVIDFTPNDGDTDFIQKKCCAFWNFISTCPELENWRVVPESNISSRKTSNDIELATINTASTKEAEDIRTAVSVLEFVEEKGLITRAFEAKLPQSRCSMGSPDYFGDESKTAKLHEKHEVNIKEECSCVKPCKSTCKAEPQLEKPEPSSNRIQDMCRELQDWDIKHPKSMEPPGHPPSLNKFEM